MPDDNTPAAVDREALAAALYRLEWQADLYATPRGEATEKYERRADRLFTSGILRDAEVVHNQAGQIGIEDGFKMGREEGREEGRAEVRAAVEAVLPPPEDHCCPGVTDLINDVLAAMDDPTGAALAKVKADAVETLRAAVLAALDEAKREDLSAAETDDLVRLALAHPEDAHLVGEGDDA